MWCCKSRVRAGLIGKYAVNELEHLFVLTWLDERDARTFSKNVHVVIRFVVTKLVEVATANAPQPVDTFGNRHRRADKNPCRVLTLVRVRPRHQSAFWHSNRSSP